MIVAGTDEAGRGPLAGPVVAAAVILLGEQAKLLHLLGVRDSKKLDAAKRERLFDAMRGMGVIWAAQAASAARIDKINILQASLWAMRRSVERLPLIPDLVAVDGNKRIPGLELPQKTVVGGDAKVISIAAASIVAKVLRDRIMERLDRLFPAYGFALHKGYPTAAHREVVERIGLSPVHRRTFRCRTP